MNPRIPLLLVTVVAGSLAACRATSREETYSDYDRETRVTTDTFGTRGRDARANDVDTRSSEKRTYENRDDTGIRRDATESGTAGTPGATAGSGAGVGSMNPGDANAKPDTSSAGDRNKDKIKTDREGEMLGSLVALDEAEVKAGADAEKKEVRPAVRDFAKSMQTEHGRHADDTKALARKLALSIADTPAITTFKKAADAERAAMATLDGDAFDRAYVDAMVKGHQDALDKLDKFIAEKPRDDVVSFLKKTRDVVAHHLQMARDLSSGTQK